MRNKKILKYSFAGITFDVLNHVLLAILAIVCIYPLYYVFIYSISNPIEASKGNIYFLPIGFSLSTYKSMLSASNIMQSAFISASRTIIGTALTVFCCSLFAYILQHNKFKLKRIVYRFSVVTMYLNAGLIPYYVLMSKIHLKNSFLLYVIPSAISMFNVILIKTYMESMPKELEESAEVDGASPLRIFFRIVLPLCKPILATIAIFSAVGQWNSWQDNMYLVSNPKLQTLQLNLLTYLNDVTANLMAMKSNSASSTQNITITQTTPTSIRMTMTMIATLPILCVYPFFQRFFVKGILIGAVKG